MPNLNRHGVDMDTPMKVTSRDFPPADAAPAHEHVPVRYDIGCVGHGGRTDRHCAACGVAMPSAPVIEEEPS